MAGSGTVTVTLSDLRIAIRNVRGYGHRSREIQGRAVMAAGAVLREAVKQHLSITDHSLQDLAALGHPYARRHGSIKIHPERPFMVHKQSGRMANATTLQEILSLENGMVKSTARIGLDYGRQRYFKYVIEGTKVMLPRDTLYEVSQLRNVRQGMMKAVVNVLGPGLRTQATVRF